MSGERTTLPDGSVVFVESTGCNSSMISREFDGVCVWGQSFSRREDHAGQVMDVLAKMAANPSAFRRWWL